MAVAGLWRVLVTLMIALVAIAPIRAIAEFQVYQAEGGRPLGTVVLLHGLNRSASSMKALAVALSSAGYRVVNLDYPSAQYRVEVLAKVLDQDLRRCCAGEHQQGLHFVTHSLGGVLLRVWVARNPGWPIARSVMLSPPSQGSELVDELKDSALFKIVTGPAGQQLGTGADSLPLRLGPVPFELGIITGRLTLNPIYSWLIPGEDDGKVGVDRAQAPGMSDFLVVDETHTFIMNSEQVIQQTLRFLRTGAFRHDAEAAVQLRGSQ